MAVQQHTELENLRKWALQFDPSTSKRQEQPNNSVQRGLQRFERQLSTSSTKSNESAVQGATCGRGRCIADAHRARGAELSFHSQSEHQRYRTDGVLSISGPVSLKF